MDWVFVAVLAGSIAVAAWILKALFGGSKQAPRAEPRKQLEPAIRNVTVSIPETAIDLTTTDGISCRVAGISHWVDAASLQLFNGTVFYLRREPDNEFDQNAIAVYAGTRKIGFVPAARAEKYAPLLDEIGTEFVVTREVDYYAGDRYFLPRIPALRKLAQDGASMFDRSKYPTLILNRVPALEEPPKDLTSGYPLFSGPHKNGDRMYGFATGRSDELSKAGTPPISKLLARTVTAEIEKVRIGDKLLIARQKNGSLGAERNGEFVGELTWSDWPHISGIMDVQRVFISKDMKVVNCAGIAIPDRM